MYTDPYQYFGRLEGELWRAIRLVVDTGLHAKGWTRQQVLDYMDREQRRRRGAARVRGGALHGDPGPGARLQDRPAQDPASCATRAEKELGPRFDVRKFHTVVLANGALPLDVLEAKVESLDRQPARQLSHEACCVGRIHCAACGRIRPGRWGVPPPARRVAQLRAASSC